MSIEIYVLSDRRLSSMREWQCAINREGFDLQLSDQAVFPELSGFLPVRMNGADTGFECDHWDPADVLDYPGEIDFAHRWRDVLAFRWGASFEAQRAAWMTACAYARATDGIIFDPQVGDLLTPSSAVQVVRELEASPITEAKIHDVLRKAGLIS